MEDSWKTYRRLMEDLYKTHRRLMEDFDLGGKTKLFQNLGGNPKFYLNLGGIQLSLEDFWKTYGSLLQNLWKTPGRLMKDFDLGGKPKLF
ncbi:hypothetical protein IGI04_019406 [Brassica rapa subsp. trilocularis]|uniref:Uncharacterized protein n=1 Tax=Brassica rapa subsp. trilocularis TaxID=1813537 RepID=A0ABQ7MFR0_BRACM|nr:hypothetical protein IGI04_019406 [Brassica rapa subsp. trilocularis]